MFPAQNRQKPDLANTCTNLELPSHEAAASDLYQPSWFITLPRSSTVGGLFVSVNITLEFVHGMSSAPLISCSPSCHFSSGSVRSVRRNINDYYTVEDQEKYHSNRRIKENMGMESVLIADSDK
uniref:Uncharacterized protein n=1 Tax=Glossina pallidipes TaxID=7398 RepID=A0A1A9ZU81_GLOPL